MPRLRKRANCPLVHPTERTVGRLPLRDSPNPADEYTACSTHLAVQFCLNCTASFRLPRSAPPASVGARWHVRNPVRCPAQTPIAECPSAAHAGLRRCAVTHRPRPSAFVYPGQVRVQCLLRSERELCQTPQFAPAQCSPTAL